MLQCCVVSFFSYHPQLRCQVDWVKFTKYSFNEISQEWRDKTQIVPVPRTRVHWYRNYHCQVLRGGSRKFSAAFPDDSNYAPWGKRLSPVAFRFLGSLDQFITRVKVAQHLSLCELPSETDSISHN